MAQSAKEKAQLARISGSEDVGSGASNTAGMQDLMKAMQSLVAEQQKLAGAREAHSKELQAVAIKKEDVDVLVAEFDTLPKAALERHLRECGGDLNKALRQLVNLEPLTKA